MRCKRLRIRTWTRNTLETHKIQATDRVRINVGAKFRRSKISTQLHEISSVRRKIGEIHIEKFCILPSSEAPTVILISNTVSADFPLVQISNWQFEN
jgi:hypothetical protein